MGWASKADDEAFGPSANRSYVSGRDARHARREKRPPPKRTMTIQQDRSHVEPLALPYQMSEAPRLPLHVLKKSSKLDETSPNGKGFHGESAAVPTKTRPGCASATTHRGRSPHRTAARPQCPEPGTAIAVMLLALQGLLVRIKGSSDRIPWPAGLASWISFSFSSRIRLAVSSKALVSAAGFEVAISTPPI